MNEKNIALNAHKQLIENVLVSNELLISFKQLQNVYFNVKETVHNLDTVIIHQHSWGESQSLSIQSGIVAIQSKLFVLSDLCNLFFRPVFVIVRLLFLRVIVTIRSEEKLKVQGP